MAIIATHSVIMIFLLLGILFLKRYHSLLRDHASEVYVNLLNKHPFILRYLCFSIPLIIIMFTLMFISNIIIIITIMFR